MTPACRAARRHRHGGAAVRRLCPLVLLLSGVICVPARAQQPEPPRPLGLGNFRDIEELSLDDLLDVTVSIAAAGRVQRLEEAPSIVSVIRDEEIRRMGVQTLEELLETVPGFEVLTDNLGRSRIAVRGVATQGTSENVLILFNGRRLNEHVHGGATVVNLDFPLHNLKQVEIIRGPGSALYGANAFVGVINLVPYTSRNFDGMEASVGGGSFATRQLSLVTGHTRGEVGLSTAVQFRDTEGPRLTVPADLQSAVDRLMAARGIPAASRAPGTTAQDRRMVDASLNATFRGFSVSARAQDGASGGYIGLLDALGTGNQLESRQLMLAVEQRAALGSRAAVTARAGVTQNGMREFLNPLPPNFVRVLPNGAQLHFPQGVLVDLTSNTRRMEGGVVLDYALSSRNQLAVGVGFEQEAVFGTRSLGNFDVSTGASRPGLETLPFQVLPEVSRHILSAFAQDSWSPVPALGITAGLRYDRYNDFGTTVNPRAGIVWRLPRDLHVKALYGRAFRAPTFRELFYNVPGSISGNALLDPSTISTYELALGYKRENFRITGNYFVELIRDFIMPTRPIGLEGVLNSFTWINTPGLDVQGVELEAKRTFGLDHAVFANYTLQRPLDSRSGARVPEVPSHLVNLGATGSVAGRFSVSPTVLWRGARPRAAGDPRPPLEATTLLNLNFRARNLFDTFELSGTLHNALDTVYHDPSPVGTIPGDYPRPGRSFLLRLSYKL